MIEFFELMSKPFLACLILTGIHAYLGLHVIERGVIFVDLALAQVAAFGATVGILWGWALHSTEGYLCSLGFTIAGAAVLALTRMRKPVVPQEALIGIVYVLAAAASIMILSRTPEGGEELKNLMVGHLLFVDWAEIVNIFLIYSVVGAVHFMARRQFFLISATPEQALSEGMNVRAWDFLFYASFGVVVTSSTELAGVLLVFSFLIVPAVCATLLANKIRHRLYIGWIAGVVTTLLGITASYSFDFPTGATVVCAFGVTLLLCALLRSAGLVIHPNRPVM